MKTKRIVVAVAALALVAGACSKGQNYGNCNPDDKKCIAASRDLPKSASPTPKRSTTKKVATKSATPTSTAPVAAGYQPKTYIFKIRDVGHGFEPNQKVVYKTDIIVFRNDDTMDHSFTVADFNDRSKIYKDSGPVAPGKTWKWTVTLDPGTYEFHDTKVPYLQSGRLGVSPTPK